MSFFKKIFNKEKEKVSIIIPCFNAVDTLSRTLKSIQASNHQNLEVILIDDGSEKRVDKLVESFNDQRFRYFWKENEGPGLARNFAMQKAEGEYVFFLDADDEIYPDAISNLISFSLEENLDVVGGVTVRKTFETGLESEWYRSIYKEKYVNTFNNRLSIYDDTLSTNKIYRLNVLKDNNIYFPEGLYEDKVFTAEVYSKIDRIGLIPNRVYIWYVYGQSTSITTSKTIANFEERLVAMYRTWKHLPELRKYYQFRAFFTHDLLIYLREFVFYSEDEKWELFRLAKEFIDKNHSYFYERLLPQSFQRGCLEAIIKNDLERFKFISTTISYLYQDSLKKEERV